MILSGKRAQTIMDLLLVMILLTVFGVAILIGMKVSDDLDDEIQADTSLSTEAKDFSRSVNTQYPSFMDTAFLLALVLFWILLLVSSFMIDAHPVFFIVTIVLLFFVFLIGMVLSNTWQDISSDADLTASAAKFPVMTWVYANFLIVIIAIGFSAALALYAKNKIG